ncbi:DUF7373 family lipoprotein [Geodermatophilus amargosae]|uniref:DUF7373 family lipoprotein n=1 Tax=Geodermatophilus amargosae TaxID=1296565 RepID=UPI0034DED4A1
MTGTRGRRVGGVAAAVAAGVLLAGCTSTVSGTATPLASAAPTTSGSPAPTTPSEPPIDVTPAPGPTVGTLVEAHRIASVTSLVPVTFPSRTETCFPSGPWSDAGALDAAYFGSGTAGPVLDRWGFVTAWGQCNSDPADGRGTLTMVAELSDPESAARAARELAEDQATGGYEPAQVPGLDGEVLLQESGEEDVVQAFVPVGRMLAYAYHTAGSGQGLEDVGRLMADQVPLLQSFRPTPQDQVPTLPTDPNGLQRLTLDPPGDLTDSSGPYDLEGYLRLAIDPAVERDLLTANGFTGFYSKQSEEADLSYAVALYAFPSSLQTNAVYSAFARLEDAEFGGTPFQLPSVPDAPCFWFESGESYYQRCYVGYGSHLASVDVLGLDAPDDVAAMDRLLPAQRDLIDG